MTAILTSADVSATPTDPNKAKVAIANAVKALADGLNALTVAGAPKAVQKSLQKLHNMGAYEPMFRAIQDRINAESDDATKRKVAAVVKTQLSRVSSFKEDPDTGTVVRIPARLALVKADAPTHDAAGTTEVFRELVRGSSFKLGITFKTQERKGNALDKAVKLVETWSKTATPEARGAALHRLHAALNLDAETSH